MKLHDLDILYIEEDRDISSQVVALLSPICNRLIHVDSAEEALVALKKKIPALVICATSLSGTDIINLCNTFKSYSSSLKILLHMGADEAALFFRTIPLEIDGYVAKPLDPPAFMHAVKKIAHAFILNDSKNEALHLANQLANAFEVSAIVSKTNPKGIITYANKSFEAISGYTKEELLGKPHNIVRHPDMPKSAFEEMWGTIREGKVWKGVVKNRHKNGSSYTVEATVIPILDLRGKPIEYMSVRHDITEYATKNLYLQDVASKNEAVAQTKTNELLEKLYKDEVTNLPNSLALQRDITHYTGGTLFLLDINNFNIFNKLYGFAFGDELLHEISKHLMFLFSQNEVLYKLSADRYALLSSAYNEEAIDNVCNEIFAYFDNTEIEINGIDNLVNFSIGAAKIEDGRDAIVDAEFALDLSKKHGKRFRVIYNSNSIQIKEELEGIGWLNKTREFIYKDMIVPYYQPIVDVRTREVYKYECLARVIDGDLVIPPLMFLGAATKLGLLTSVTKSMINKSFRYFSDKDMRFSINITERDIMDGYLMEFIKLKAERYGVKPENITFEILENITLSKESDIVAGTIGLVKDYGCDIAIDDFGSENSNFSRLLSLKSDYIKIDGSFVQGCDTDLEKQKIIDAIVQLGKRLGIKSVAEFVSNEAIFETIKRLGVDYAQGYLFGKPEPETL